MGNHLDSKKISSLILELSETSDLNAKFLINNFNNLIELTGGQNQPYQIIKSLFFDLINSNPDNFSYNHLQNFGNNVLQYITLQQKETYISIIKPCITFLAIIIDSLYEIFKDKLTINFIKNFHNISWDVLKKVFPFNLILFCIDTILNEGKLILNNNDLNFNILFLSFSILYHIIILPNNKTNNQLNIENIEIYKFILSSNSFLEKEKFEKFNQIIFSSFFTTFINIIESNQNNLPMSERYVNILLSFIIYFLEDTNQILFKDIKNEEQNLSFYFKNNNNEIYFNFLSKLESNLERIPIIIIEMINYYTKYNKEVIIKNIMLNNKQLNEFIIRFYRNYDKLNDFFKEKINYLFIRLFNIIPNLFEISSVKDFIPFILTHLMEKEDNKSIIEYILFNYIITSDIYKKLVSDSENNKYIQNNFEKIITHFLKVILNLQNNILKEYKSGMITYSLIIIYNITLFVHKFNDYSILLKLFEFVKIEIENEDKDIISKFVIYYFFILIIINLLNYLEEHSYFHMLLLKNYEIIINLYDKLTKLNNNSNTKKIFEKIKDKKNIIDELINRINKKFKEEGSDWRFNQDVEIIRIINKVIFLPNETKKKFIKIQNFEQQNIEKGIIASNIKNNLYNISTLNYVYSY
jgi:hypothetical protein